MEKTGGLDAGVSSPHRAEQAVYPKVITVTGESSSAAERELGKLSGKLSHAQPWKPS